MKKNRTSIWVNPDLVLMIKSKGIDVSAFVNRAMELFLDIPEDPREVLIKKKTDEVVHKLLLSFRAERAECIKIYSDQEAARDAEKSMKNENLSRLQEVGDELKKTSCYPKVLEALKNLDPDSSCWEVALREINNRDGTRYEFEELWNKSLEWYRHGYVAKT